MSFELEDDLQKYLDGQVMLIDKPLNWTSFDVVNKIRYSIKRKFNLKKIKVGHAGTLDPLASGLLIVCVGKFTKRISEFQNQNKEYTGTITLGSTTPSYDLETDFDQQYEVDHITEKLIEEARQKFLGNIEQVAPKYSAKRVDGEKAYNLARKGEDVKIKSHHVEIKSFDFEAISMPNLDFRISCSKGTYIRSIAHDFGQALNSGAHLSALRRTRIGNFDVADAVQMETNESRNRSFRKTES
ncbi:MAG: tRNA pseudouridine(55) synthase TruB [Flavobacteriales bacterium]|nr:tRNA pseudouridine(55) synthase TruB [Flavobacteriales bacterium]